MYHDVMVKPAECGEVVGIGGATISPGDDVVGLEPIAAGAAVGGAATIPIKDGSAQFR